MSRRPASCRAALCQSRETVVRSIGSPAPSLSQRPRSRLRVRTGITNSVRLALVAGGHLGRDAPAGRRSDRARAPGPISTDAESVGLGRADRSPRLARAVDDDHAAGVLELQIADPQRRAPRRCAGRCRSALGERPVDLRAGVQVEGDLVQAQVLALDVRRPAAAGPERRVASRSAVLDRIVQAHDQRPERVVDRLGAPFRRPRPPRPAHPSSSRTCSTRRRPSGDRRAPGSSRMRPLIS